MLPSGEQLDIWWFVVEAPGDYVVFINKLPDLGVPIFFDRTSGIACRYLLVVIIVYGVSTIVAG